MTSALIATLDHEIQSSLIKGLQGEQFEVTSVSDYKSCVNAFQDNHYEFTFVDLQLLRVDEKKDFKIYKKQLETFWKINPNAQVVFISEKKLIDHAIKAIELGPSEVLNTPVDPAEVKLAIHKLKERIRLKEELEYFREIFWEKDLKKLTKTKSKKMREVLEKFKITTQTKMTVLLTGETGTGKSAFAKLIHSHSERKDKQFISIHCGAIPDTLIESELFGHEKGAFTGATCRKLGKFEIANGGTIFLDEIGTITPALQVKLLQVLQEGVFERLGGLEQHITDVRVIAATNENLVEMVRTKEFREDLYYRLNVFPIEVPALRERLEDLPHIVKSYLDKYKMIYGKSIDKLQEEVMIAFKAYAWPGNIRELENVLERAYLLESSKEITAKSCPVEIIETQFPIVKIPLNTSQSLADIRRKAVDDIECQYLKQLMTEHESDLKQISKIAAIGERQLYNLLVKYDIHKKEYAQQ